MSAGNSQTLQHRTRLMTRIDIKQSFSVVWSSIPVYPPSHSTVLFMIRPQPLCHVAAQAYTSLAQYFTTAYSKNADIKQISQLDSHNLKKYLFNCFKLLTQTTVSIDNKTFHLFQRCLSDTMNCYCKTLGWKICCFIDKSSCGDDIKSATVMSANMWNCLKWGRFHTNQVFCTHGILLIKQKSDS